MGDALFQLGFRITQSLQTLSPALDGFMNTISFLVASKDRRTGVRTLLILIYADFANTSLKLKLAALQD